jgi:hypothetical protein
MHSEKWTAKGEAHIVPISYHLANDPMHMRLLEVCRQDIEVLMDEIQDGMSSDQ